MKKGERERGKDESVSFPRKTQWNIIQKHIYLGWSCHELLCSSRRRWDRMCSDIDDLKWGPYFIFNL